MTQSPKVITPKLGVSPIPPYVPPSIICINVLDVRPTLIDIDYPVLVIRSIKHTAVGTTKRSVITIRSYFQVVSVDCEGIRE